MSDLDDEIDRLYQGPLEGFTDRRNALAKAFKRPDVKALAKPSVPAWAVNQLFWHQRPVLDRVVTASMALLAEHRQTLAGKPSDVRTAEGSHRDALRAALAAARDLLAAARQPATPATLEAVRQTLQALPAPDANGRLVRPLTPQGLEALTGLVLAARVSGPEAAPPSAPRPTAAAVAATSPPSAAGNDAAQASAARAKAKAVKAAKEREAARRKAEAALASARESLTAADAAVEQAERDLASRQAERVAARDAVKRAQRMVEELSFGR
ncbi:MAG: hypothetical protein IT181_08290 [Acidobacteria bacterium]|nr:hypothetical protein [Acidobacteriota bacterium]